MIKDGNLFLIDDESQCVFTLTQSKELMKLIPKNQTFLNRIFSGSGSANGAPEVDFEAPK